MGDDDGVVFLEEQTSVAVIEAAEAIKAAERRQAEAMRAGRTLRTLTSFDAYLKKRAESPSYGFREHLRSTGGAIEE